MSKREREQDEVQNKRQKTNDNNTFADVDIIVHTHGFVSREHDLSKLLRTTLVLHFTGANISRVYGWGRHITWENDTSVPQLIFQSPSINKIMATDYSLHVLTTNGEIVAVREENAKIALDGRVVDFAYVDEEIMWIILHTGQMHKTEDGITEPYNLPEPLSSISCGVKNGEYYASEACDSLFGLTSDGRAYVWAVNHYGQLGLGHRDHVDEPTELPGFDNIVKFAVGEDHVLFLTAGGEVYGMGENDKGQITSAISKKNCKRPTLVEELEGINIVDIAAGNEFSLALTDDGQVYSWGTKQHGVLGRKGKSKPKLVTGLNRQVITSISCGFSHAMAATTREVFWWGFYAGCGVPYQKTPAKVDLPSDRIVSVYAKGAALFALC